MITVTRSRGKIASISLVLFVLSLFLTAYSAHNPWTATIGATAASFIMRPFELLHSSVSGGVAGVWKGYFALVDVRRENETLKQRLQALEAQNSRLMESESESERLRTLLDFTRDYGVRGIAARVIGRNPSSWVHTVTIDVGREEGITEGMPVIQGDGVVGQVTGVGQGSSRVLLVSDPASGIDVIVQEGRQRGVVEGAGEGCQLKYLQGDLEIKIGDRVITSGMDGVYPKGLLVGFVSEIDRRAGAMFQSVALRPAASFSNLEEVLVITSSVRKDPSSAGIKAFQGARQGGAK